MVVENFTARVLDQLGLRYDDLRQLRPDLIIMDLAMPLIKNLDPERLRVVKLALQRLQLIQQEGAVLMMPELLIGR